MKNWKASSNDSGVSEVIGTILLLGISVTFFSVIYVTVLSFPGGPVAPSSSIALSLDETSLTLMHVGGEPLDLDTKIQIAIDNNLYNVTTVKAQLGEEETKNDGYWGFGENVSIDFSAGIPQDTSEYTIAVTVVDVDSNSVILMGTKLITNRPPIIGSPFPYNTAIDISIDTSHFNVSISDPDNDTFNWMIQCNNGQTASGAGESNGIKSLPLSGLTLLTTYKVWVNATDLTGSGQWTNKSYMFTTEGNHPPRYGMPSPANQSMDNSLGFTWSILINDREGNSFNWRIECSNGAFIYANGESNGSKSLSLSGLSYFTTYTLWVNATDPAPDGSGLWTRSMYIFTTKKNNPPMYGEPSPTNDSAGNWLSLTWSIPINESEGELFNWTIQCSNGQKTDGINDVNGTKALTLTGLAYSTTYKVWVNATDPTGSGNYTRQWYRFTTKVNNRPEYGTPIPVNGTTGKILSWSIPISDPEGNLIDWTIQCSNGQSASGTNEMNGTKSLTLFESQLSHNKYYKVWVNATDPSGSGLYLRRWYWFTYNKNM